MKATFALVVLVLCVLWVHTGSYNDELAAANERAKRVLRATPAPKQEAAPVWSARCEKKGMDRMIKQSDGNPPKAFCVPRRVLEVGA